MAVAGREALLGVEHRGALPVAADKREVSADADGVVSGARDPALCPGGMSRQIGGYNGYTYDHLPCPKLPKRLVAIFAIFAACMAFSNLVIR